MTPEQIPDEVVEAAAIELCASDGFMWDLRPEAQKERYRNRARAALAAGLAAWKTSAHRSIRGWGYDEVGRPYPALILPLKETGE